MAGLVVQENRINTMQDSLPLVDIARRRGNVRVSPSPCTYSCLAMSAIFERKIPVRICGSVLIYNRRQWPLCLVDYFYYNNVYADAQLSIRELSSNPLRVHCTEVAAAAMEKRANGQGLFYNRCYRAYTYIPIYVFCVHIFLVIEIVLLVGTLLVRLLRTRTGRMIQFGWLT